VLVLKNISVGWLCSVLRPRQHSIGYMGDRFYRSEDPTNSIKVLNEDLQKTKQTTKTTKYRYAQTIKIFQINNRQRTCDYAITTMKTVCDHRCFWFDRQLFNKTWLTSPGKAARPGRILDTTKFKQRLSHVSNGITG